MDPGEAAVEAARIEARERQYSTYVHWTERLIERRAEANKFYMTLNFAIVGAIGFLFSESAGRVGGLVPPEWISAAFAFAGLAASFNWRAVIASLRKVTASKFDTFHELERALPAKPYADEWSLTSSNRKKVSVSRFEARLPWMFMAFFALALGVSVARGWGVDVAELLSGVRAQLAP
jgi:hypothetical protein